MKARQLLVWHYIAMKPKAWAILLCRSGIDFDAVVLANTAPLLSLWWLLVPLVIVALGFPFRKLMALGAFVVVACTVVLILELARRRGLSKCIASLQGMRAHRFGALPS